ncbi:MAG TPA: MBL fold metallo-hydrolase [Acidimicrobiales bacterium]
MAVSAPRVGEGRTGDGTLVMTLLGVGAMASPRYRPAGLLVVCGGRRLAIDGGPGAEPRGRLDAWLVTDDRSELRGPLRRLAAARGVEPVMGPWRSPVVTVEPHPVVHTAHPTVGYLVESAAGRVAWAPEFLVFPAWAAGVDLMFAEAAGWDRPIRFARGVGGHAPVLDVAAAAQRSGVRRLVLAHVGRPTIRAVDAGRRPPYGELGEEGRRYVVRRRTKER